MEFTPLVLARNAGEEGTRRGMRWGGEGTLPAMRPHLSHVTSCHGPLSSPVSREKTDDGNGVLPLRGIIGPEML